MKMVRVDDICNLCTLYFHGECTIGDIEDCECLVRSKIVDAEPVKHGYWLAIGMRFAGAKLSHYCSICGGHGQDTMQYCPNCGAKMDGE